MNRKYIIWPEFEFPPINLWSVWYWSGQKERIEEDIL